MLGPILFLELVADIDNDVEHSEVRSFANSARVMKGVNGVRECSYLQSDLQKIYQWAEENNMSFNDSKFQIVRYGTDSVLKLTTNYLSSNSTLIQEYNDI